MTILVTGANGQLGSHLRLLAPLSAKAWIFTDADELDITDRAAVDDFVAGHNIGLVINCAAYTNVDRAENDEETAMRVNATAVGNLAHAMQRHDGWLVHVSTDYVFGGNPNNRPCTEAQQPNPTCAYGRTKLAGEIEAQQCRSTIIRTSWLYSEFGKNFLLTMLRLTATQPQVKVVFDQTGTPTYVGDLAKAIFTIVESGAYLDHAGLYNYSNEGVCSWYDFAHAIAAYSGHTSCDIVPCHSGEFPSPVERPAYSVLDKTKFKQTFGLSIPHWTDAMQRCIDNINQQ